MKKLEEIKELKNDRQLREFLGISSACLKRLSSRDKECVSKKSLYEENKDNVSIDFAYFYISSKKGKRRKIYEAISPDAKTVLKHIRNFLDDNYINPDCVHGFVKGRSIQTNAFNHINKKILINLDIKNFFESIKLSQVKEVFKKFDASNSVANKLAKITTINNFLPQGFYTSPVLSNIVFLNIDEKILKDAAEKGYTYSRYGDDMSFSSNMDNIDLKDVYKIIKSHGFSLNEKKTKIMRKGKKQVVTGLSVADKDFPRIPKKIKKLLRMHYYFLDKLGEVKYSKGFHKPHSLSNVRLVWLEGWYNYLNSIEPILAEKYFPIIEKEKIAQEELCIDDIDIFDLY